MHCARARIATRRQQQAADIANLDFICQPNSITTLPSHIVILSSSYRHLTRRDHHRHLTSPHPIIIIALVTLTTHLSPYTTIIAARHRARTRIAHSPPFTSPSPPPPSVAIVQFQHLPLSTPPPSTLFTPIAARHHQHFAHSPPLTRQQQPDNKHRQQQHQQQQQQQHLFYLSRLALICHCRCTNNFSNRQPSSVIVTTVTADVAPRATITIIEQQQQPTDSASTARQQQQQQLSPLFSYLTSALCRH